MDNNNPLIGKIVRAVFLSAEGGALRFDFDNNDSIVVRADGDCCSYSWIEEVQGIDQLIGSPVVAVEDIDMPDRPGNRYGHDEDVMAYYGCKITTQKGYALIDYRNSSNGYYGGNLSWPGEYFYGGVHGQNGTTEEWREITASA